MFKHLLKYSLQEEKWEPGNPQEVLKEDEVICEILKYNYKLNSVCIQFRLVYNHLTNTKKINLPL